MVLFLYRSTKRRKNIILTRVYGGVIMRILDDQKTLRDALLGFSNKRELWSRVVSGRNSKPRSGFAQLPRFHL